MIIKGGVGSGIAGIEGHRTAREATAKLSPKQRALILEKLKGEKEKRGQGDTQKKSPDLSQQDINNFIENVLKHIKIKMKE